MGRGKDRGWREVWLQSVLVEITNHSETTIVLSTFILFRALFFIAFTFTFYRLNSFALSLSLLNYREGFRNPSRQKKSAPPGLNGLNFSKKLAELGVPTPRRCPHITSAKLGGCQVDNVNPLPLWRTVIFCTNVMPWPYIATPDLGFWSRTYHWPESQGFYSSSSSSSSCCSLTMQSKRQARQRTGLPPPSTFCRQNYSQSSSTWHRLSCLN